MKKITSCINLLVKKVLNLFKSKEERLVNGLFAVSEKLYSQLNRPMDNEVRAAVYMAISRANYLSIKAKSKISNKELAKDLIELKTCVIKINQERTETFVNKNEPTSQEKMTETIFIENQDFRMAA